MAIVTLRPAELDPQAINLRAIGDLVANRATADLYMVVEVDGKKSFRLISGAAKYDLMNHLHQAHVIQDYTPTSYDPATIWYDTSMVYVEPASIEDAYITVQVETTPGVYKWQRVMPISAAKNIILGKNAAGNIITLEDIVIGERAKVIPAATIESAAKGELVVKDDNTVWLKSGTTASDMRLLSDITNDMRDRLRTKISISQVMPTNFDKNTLWYKLQDDADYALAQSAYMNIVDTSKMTGLKFVQDNEGVVESGATIFNESKSISIDNNVTQNWGHTWLNFGFIPNTKVYFELDVEAAPEGLLQLLFLTNGYTQPLGNLYGTEVDGSSLLITSANSKFKNVEVAKPFTLNKKTIFVMIDKGATNAKIILGYVLADGSLQSIYGNHLDGTPGFQMVLARFAIGASASATANLKTIVNIRDLKVATLPTGYISINSTLPNETPFMNAAVVTNAQSLYIGNKEKLSTWVDSGRLIISPRSYADRSNLKVGELSLDLSAKKLYSRASDGTVFPIAGEYDGVLLDHIKNSVQVTNKIIGDIKLNTDDPSRIYVKKGTFNSKDAATTINGNLTVIDNSTEGDAKTYKIVMPTTVTPYVMHDWVSIGSGSAKSDTLKVYLDELNNIVSTIVNKDSIYSGFEDLNLTKTLIQSSFPTSTLFFKEVSEKRMRDDSLYIQTITEAGPVATELINKIFNTPANAVGEVHVYKDSSKYLYLTMKTRLGKTYTAYVDPTSNYVTSAWRENVESVTGLTTIPDALSVTGISAFAGNTTLNGANNTIKGAVTLTAATSGLTVSNTNITSSGTMNLIKYSGDVTNGSVKITVGETLKSNIVTINSTTRPTWVDDTGKSFQWMVASDVANSWNFKGLLNTSSGALDINTLKDQAAIGYYLLTNSPSAAITLEKGYPTTITGTTGVLHVYKDTADTTVTQVFMTNDTNGGHYFIRKYNGTIWSPWYSFANNLDLDLKYDKTGGAITGNTTISGNLSAAGNTSLRAVTLNKITSGTTSTWGIETPILDTLRNGASDLLQIGSLPVEKISFLSPAVPEWNDGTTKVDLATVAQINAINTNLTTNYWTGSATKTELDKKVDIITYNTDMSKKFDKVGGSITGATTITAGGLTINNGGLTVAINNEFNLPSRIFDSSTAFDAMTGTEYANTIRYDLIKTGTMDDTMLSFSLPKSTTTGATSSSGLQIYNTKDGKVMMRSMINKSLFSGWRTLLMTDMIKDDFTGGVTYISSAERVKYLFERLHTRFRSGVGTYIPTTSYNLSNMVGLEPGQYPINTDQELTAIGLDLAKVGGRKGSLVVETEKLGTSVNKIFRFIPITDQADNKDNILAVMNTAGTATAKWMYIYDSVRFYTKIEIDTMMATNTATILSKFISPNYSFTGNSVNNSIPMKLVHTHNQESLGDAATMWFETNITTSSTADQKRFVINLRGYATGYGSTTNVIGGSSIDIDIIGLINYSGSAPVIIHADVINKTEGSSVTVGNVTLSTANKLQFSVKDNVTNQGLSFDTYMRFSSIADTTFNGAITRHKLGTTGF